MGSLVRFVMGCCSWHLILHQEEGNQGQVASASPARRLLQLLQNALQKAALALAAQGDAFAIGGLHRYCLKAFSSLPKLLAR